MPNPKYLLCMCLLTSGCVTASAVRPENPEIVQTYSCEVLEQRLAQYGALRDNSEANQNALSGKNVAGYVASNILTLGLASQAVALANVKNAGGNEKKYKEVIGAYYTQWDRKKCSEWLYKKNQDSKQ